jgi:dTDP-4-dehydrorhamnose reductase
MSDELVSITRNECDLRDSFAISRTIRNASPQVILNAAAYTAVDQAESDPENCLAINGVAPGVMATEAARCGALLVHYSTDYVFDGTKAGAYDESDEANPRNQYGKSKLEGERAIQATKANYLLFRTSWVFSPHGKNFVTTMLRLAKERDSLKVVDDQIGSPTSAAAIAGATARVIRIVGNDSKPSAGLYHMTAAGEVTWCGFAREICRRAHFEQTISVTPIRSEDYPTPAHRPKNSRLSNDRFSEKFGFRLSSWQEQLDETLSSLGLAGRPLGGQEVRSSKS